MSNHFWKRCLKGATASTALLAGGFVLPVTAVAAPVAHTGPIGTTTGSLSAPEQDNQNAYRPRHARTPHTPFRGSGTAVGSGSEAKNHLANSNGRIVTPNGCIGRCNGMANGTGGSDGGTASASATAAPTVGMALPAATAATVASAVESATAVPAAMVFPAVMAATAVMAAVAAVYATAVPTADAGATAARSSPSATPATAPVAMAVLGATAVPAGPADPALGRNKSRSRRETRNRPAAVRLCKRTERLHETLEELTLMAAGRSGMRLHGPACRLTIFIGESDQYHHRPLYAEIVHRARKADLAGASVFRGIEGFGASTHIHTAGAWHLREDLPCVIVIVDTRARIEDFLIVLDDLVADGLVILDDVEVYRYVGRPGKEPRERPVR
jgi:uncharacterized protein